MSNKTPKKLSPSATAFVGAMMEGMKTSGKKYAKENELREATYAQARAEGKSPREEWERVKKTLE